MRAEDWSSLAALDKEIFPDDPLEKEAFERFVNSNSFFGLETKYGKLVGYLKLNEYKDGSGHLSRIGVAKVHQNQGSGTHLMDFALQWFRAHQVHQIDLYTQDFNLNACIINLDSNESAPLGITFSLLMPFTLQRVNTRQSGSCLMK